MAGKQIASVARPSVFTVDATGAVAGPAAKDLNVSLAEPPSDAAQTFKWDHCKIGDGGALLDAATGQPVPRNTDINYWCVWSVKPIPATEFMTFYRRVAGAFDLAGDGFPLPTQWKDGKLCLPEVRKLVITWFDVTGVNDPPDPNDPKNRNGQQKFLEKVAKDYYGQLLIDVDIQLQPRPAAITINWRLQSTVARDQMRHPDRFDKDPTKKYHENALEDATPNASPLEPQPDLGKVLPIPGDPKRTIVLLDILRFDGLNILGMTFPTTPITKKTVHQSELFAVPAKPGIMIMSRPTPGGISHPKRVEHELGHALLHDPGLGKQMIERGTTNDKPSVLAFLAKLKLRLSYDDLPDDRHETLSSNLMFANASTGLKPIQVAIMRAAHELQPGAGLMPEPS